VVCTIKKYTLESFSECTGVSNVVEVGRKRKKKKKKRAGGGGRGEKMRIRTGR